LIEFFALRLQLFVWPPVLEGWCLYQRKGDFDGEC
jgi:hypothetical protein